MAQIIQVASGKANISIDRQLLAANDKAVISQREAARLLSTALGDEILDLGPGLLFTAPINLTAINSDSYASTAIVPGFRGRIVATFALVTTAASTASRTASLQLTIDDDPVSGGAIVLTSANFTPAGKVVAATRIVDGAADTNVFAADSEIQWQTTAAPTTFAEGVVVFGVLVAPARILGPLDTVL